MSGREAFAAGFRDVSPILIGVIPFGLISGAATVAAGISPAAAVGMAVLIFAGAAQLASVQLIAAGAASPVILLTAVVINLRMLMYSASLAPYLRQANGAWKSLLAYLLTDQAYALSVVRYEQDLAPELRRWYTAGVATTLWVVWQASTIVGIAVGAQVPPAWGLDFAIPLTFLGLLIPVLQDGPTRVAAGGAAIAAVVAAPLPYNAGLLIAAAVGIAAGLAAETVQSRRVKG